LGGADGKDRRAVQKDCMVLTLIQKPYQLADRPAWDVAPGDRTGESLTARKSSEN